MSRLSARILVSSLVLAAVAASSATAVATSGIPAWPWLPGGLAWQPTAFKTTPFTVHQVNDDSVPKGQVLVKTPGAEGEVLYVGRKAVPIAPATPEVVAVGTEIVKKAAIGGKIYNYDRVLSMETTAYNGSVAMNGPSGAVAAWNGEPLKPGDVAVDPSVIALGTYLYIDGYGPARAVDTGSAIVGDHIDLFFNESNEEISLWGIQFHKVYILTGRPAGFNA